MSTESEEVAIAIIAEQSAAAAEGTSTDAAAAGAAAGVDDTISDTARSAPLPNAATATVSANNANDNDTTASALLSAEKRFSVPEMPQWRFVNKAKKTEGYSTESAGSIVKGLSAQELVSKYNVSWKESKKNMSNEKNVEYTEDDDDHQKLDGRKESRNVGKLNVREGGENVLEETFEKISKLKKGGVDDDDDVKEEEEDVGEVKQEEIEKVAKVVEEEKVEEQQQQQQLAIEKGMEAPEVAIIVEAVMPTAPSSDYDELDQVEKQQPVVENEKETSIQVEEKEEDPMKPVDPTQSPSVQSSDRSPKQEEEEDETRRKKKWILLLLLLLAIVIIAAVLGVILGGKNNSKEENTPSNGDKATTVDDNDNASDTIAPTFLKSQLPTNSPTKSPSTYYCPIHTQLFSMQHTTTTTTANNNLFDKEEEVMMQQEDQFWTNFTMTWVVKDACSGNEIMKCLPCRRPNIDNEHTTTSLSSSLIPSASPVPEEGVRQQSCIGQKYGHRPRPLRDGERFRFNLLGGGGGGDDDAGQCVDDSDRLYERGEFDDVPNFGECAERCVLNTPESLAFNVAFRGYDYDCPSKSCYCLYDRGTLNNGNTKDFDSSSYGDLGGVSWSSEEYTGGMGEIAGVSYKVGYYGYYCGKLVEEEGVDEDEGYAGDYAGVVENYVASSHGVSGCLPHVNQYVFELKPSVEECCGFAPESYFATYGNVVVKVGEVDVSKSNATDGGNATENNVTKSIVDRTYFASERSEPCPSSTPSAMPTGNPTASPTLTPLRNVVYPSEIAMYPCRESTESEMAGRIVGLDGTFCGFCLWKLTDFTCYQRVNFLVTQYDITYVAARQSLLDRDQCKIPEDGVPEDMLERIERMAYCGNVPTISEEDAVAMAERFKELQTFPPTSLPTARSEPTPSPSQAPTTSEPSSSPSKTPTVDPTNRPTSSPSASPSKRPSMKPTISPTQAAPTLSPTDKPSCDAEYQDFNLCIAIDMSGSVCNHNTDLLCNACEPESICKDDNVDKGTCCNNFLEIIEFTKLMVSNLGSIQAEQSYSLVGFGNTATFASLYNDNNSPGETNVALDQLTYSGGRTNHADAINVCRDSLASSTNNGKNLILLITDGDPSMPLGSPQVDAEQAAAGAKSDGIFIIPVMILPRFLYQETYLQGISSDGSVFSVSDFDVLDGLHESLLAQVSCQV